MSAVIGMARITAKGQITLPAAVRDAVEVRNGDDILFIRDNDGRIRVSSSELEAILRTQIALEGAADEAGISSEDDLLQLISQVRKEKYSKEQR